MRSIDFGGLSNEIVPVLPADTRIGDSLAACTAASMEATSAHSLWPPLDQQYEPTAVGTVTPAILTTT